MKKVILTVILAAVTLGGCAFHGVNDTPGQTAEFIPATFPTQGGFSENNTDETAARQENTADETEKTGNVTYPGAAVGKTAKGSVISVKDGMTYVDGVLIVNKSYSISEENEPGALTDECAAAFDEMAAAAASEGIYLRVQSGYRSYSTQEGLYTRYCDSDGQDAADRYSARPGHSEHETGLAIDVNSVTNAFKDTPEGIWLAAHCPEYGFILRYPEGKEAQTGYIYEPWHIRYLGDRSLAREITDSGLCLEEYFGIDSVYD